MVGIQVKVDASKARAHARAMIKRGPVGRRAAVIASTRTVLRRALATAVHDTNRYRNGWAAAGNAAGIGVFIIRPLNRASRFAEFEKRLREEVVWWQRIVDRYQRQERRDRWSAQAERRLARAREEYERLLKTDKGAAIVINGRSSLGSKRGPRALFKVYGGTGRVMDLGGSRTVVVLQNKEPHTSIVEKNTKNMRRAASILRGSGLAAARSAYFSRALAKAGV